MASGNVWEVRNLKFVILFLISWIINSSASAVRTTASSVFFFFWFLKDFNLDFTCLKQQQQQQQQFSDLI